MSAELLLSTLAISLEAKDVTVLTVDSNVHAITFSSNTAIRLCSCVHTLQWVIYTLHRSSVMYMYTPVHLSTLHSITAALIRSVMLWSIPPYQHITFLSSKLSRSLHYCILLRVAGIRLHTLFLTLVGFRKQEAYRLHQRQQQQQQRQQKEQVFCHRDLFEAIINMHF